jgi:putative hemolysin
MIFEIVIILILLSLNGILAMSEFAFVSAKRFKLAEKANKGNSAAKKALQLLAEPEKFLSAIQIGITFIGIVAGAFGGYAMAEDLAPYLQKFDFLKTYSQEISFGLIVILITYLSLIIGELVPKSIALNNPEKITLLTAPLMHALTKAFTPIVGFLSITTKGILSLIGVKKNEDPPVTEDELKSLLELGTTHGTFEKEESEMINKIFSFNDKKVSSVMVPRIEIEWIDSKITQKEIFNFVSTHQFSKYFLCEDNIDNVLGYIEAKEFLINYNTDPLFDIRSILHQALVVPECIYSIELVEKFRSQRTNIALVVDEYGGTQGLITLHDLVENILGDLPEKFEESEQRIIKRSDGTFLVDGSIEIIKISDFFSIEFNAADYATLNGFIMHQLGRISKEGDIINHGSYQFEVIDMDGKRIDKVLVKEIKN